MHDDISQKRDNLPTDELESIVHKGENLHISTSLASQDQRILESRRHAHLSFLFWTKTYTIMLHPILSFIDT